jgi:drug/metabolite transporter (DMT)-like permease
MLITGTANVLLYKLQDRVCIGDCDTSKPQLFEQPVWQTLIVFFGGFGTILGPIFIHLQKRFGRYQLVNSEGSEVSIEATSDSQITKPLTGVRKLLMWLPALCDICGTTLMNICLIITSASVFQMLRGAIVIFVALFSVIFLNRKLQLYQWVSLLSIVLGVSLVGLSGILKSSPPNFTNDTNDGMAVLGVIMVLVSQIFVATQFVLEEKILSRYSVGPIEVAYLEGFFGIITVSFAILVGHVQYGQYHPGSYWDAVTAYHQIFDNFKVWGISLVFCVSIGLFNFFGLSVTRTVSATSRSTIDTSRTLFIWMVSLVLGWETFSFLQVIGFVFLVYGTFLFNDAIDPPACLVTSTRPITSAQSNTIGSQPDVATVNETTPLIV